MALCRGEAETTRPRLQQFPLHPGAASAKEKKSGRMPKRFATSRLTGDDCGLCNNAQKVVLQRLC